MGEREEGRGIVLLTAPHYPAPYQKGEKWIGFADENRILEPRPP